jgi:hypothetical protein
MMVLWARELDTGCPSRHQSNRSDAAILREHNTERDEDSKMESSRLRADHPTAVIDLNTLFTNFGPDNCRATGGLLAIA